MKKVMIVSAIENIVGDLPPIESRELKEKLQRAGRFAWQLSGTFTTKRKYTASIKVTQKEVLLKSLKIE